MENLVCKTCGGVIERKGNYYQCKYCTSKWMADLSDDVHAVERANAWTALREGNFEKAAELFEGIIVKDKNNHEAYWGRALALNAIIYVDDANEGKKVPTCNNITENSFLENKDFKKALSLAPLDIVSAYQKQAEQIEKIRIEWLEQASKEAPYDIFISYKESDENRKRTQDSIDVQDLYTSLVEKGYRVFFSRQSLKGKIAEQYEPYIYGAIKTAKVMIVFGEKAEYFNAVWVKNEWLRFKKLLTNGEKHKNALIAVYKNMDAYDIPMALTGGKQALDYGIASNYERLLKHIERVIAESEASTHVEKISIQGGQLAKKSSQIQTETIKTREVGASKKTVASIGEKQKLDLAQSFIGRGNWDSAITLLDKILLDNPNQTDALWLSLLIKYKAPNEDALFKLAEQFNQADFDVIENTLNHTTKEHAGEILDKMYKLNVVTSESQYIRILNLILPFNYDNRTQRIREAFDVAIAEKELSTLELLLSTLDSHEVDTYIKYMLAFAKDAQNQEKIKCINKVLALDEGNLDALKMLLDTYLETSRFDEIIDVFELILQYSPPKAINKEVKELLTKVSKQLSSQEHCNIAKQLLRYYDGELKDFEKVLETLAFEMIKHSYFDDAEYILGVLRDMDKEETNANLYWGLCLVRTKASTDKGIIDSDIPLGDLDEYLIFLSKLDEETRDKYMSLQEKQAQEIKKRKLEKQRIEEERKRQQKEEQERQRREVARREAERTAEYIRQRNKKKARVLEIIAYGLFVIAFAVMFTDFNIPYALCSILGLTTLSLSLKLEYKKYLALFSVAFIALNVIFALINLQQVGVIAIITAIVSTIFLIALAVESREKDDEFLLITLITAAIFSGVDFLETTIFIGSGLDAELSSQIIVGTGLCALAIYGYIFYYRAELDEPINAIFYSVILLVLALLPPSIIVFCLAAASIVGGILLSIYTYNYAGWEYGIVVTETVVMGLVFLAKLGLTIVNL